MQFNQIDHYHEILDKFDDFLAELQKADLHFGLTDTQGQMQVELRKIYGFMTDDVLDLERKSF